MDVKPIGDMTNTELQRAIAELRGWTGIIHSASKYLLAHRPEQIAGERLRVPNWPQDTHAAVVDLLAEMEGFTLEYWREHWSICTGIEVVCSADTPTRAISEAWLAWKRGNDGSHTENL